MRSHLKSILQYISYISGRQTATRNQEGLNTSAVYVLCYKKGDMFVQTNVLMSLR